MRSLALKLIISVSNSFNVETSKIIEDTEPAARDRLLRPYLLSWIYETIPSAHVLDFWESWRDGNAFAILFCCLCPDSAGFDMEKVRFLTPLQRLQYCFDAVEEHLGVPPLFSPQQFQYGNGPSDESSVQNYIAMVLTASLGRGKSKEQLANDLITLEEQTRSRVSDMQAQMRIDKQRLHELESDMSMLQQKREQASHKEQELQTQIERDAAELAMYREEFELMQQAVQRASSSVEASMQNEQTLQKRVDDLTRELDELRGVNGEQQKRIVELNAEVYRMHNELKDVGVDFAAQSSRQQQQQQLNSHWRNDQLRSSDTYADDIGGRHQRRINSLTLDAPRADAGLKALNRMNDVGRNVAEAQMRFMEKQARDKQRLQNRDVFMSELRPRKGWFVRLKQKKGGAFNRPSIKKRFFELRGEWLLYATEDRMNDATPINLADYKAARVELQREKVESESSSFSNGVQHGERDWYSVLLEPRADSKAPIYRLMAVEWSADMRLVMCAWCDDINRHKALMQAWDLGLHAVCPPLTEFVADASLTDLVISHPVPQLRKVLALFLRSLRRR